MVDDSDCADHDDDGYVQLYHNCFTFNSRHLDRQDIFSNHIGSYLTHNKHGNHVGHHSELIGTHRDVVGQSKKSFACTQAGNGARGAARGHEGRRPALSIPPPTPGGGDKAMPPGPRLRVTAK